MSSIPQKDTKPEIIVRNYLFQNGFRYRKNVSKLPGRPDIVLSKYKTVVFVNGCYWHAHNGCKWFVPPKSNTDFWNQKFEYNKKRDLKNYLLLNQLGWTVVIVWECVLRHGDANIALEKLIHHICDDNKKGTVIHIE